MMLKFYRFYFSKDVKCFHAEILLISVSDKTCVFDAGISLILVSNKMTSFHAGILQMQHVDSDKRKAFNPGLC